MIEIYVNGERRLIDADPAMPLLYVLIDGLELHGAKYGCGLGQCGACTVLVDGKAVFSCLLPLGAVSDREVTTIEAFADLDSAGHDLIDAFTQEQAAQCGYCIPGMVMRAESLLRANPTPTEQELRAGMQPNLCRCGTHMRILRAVRRAAAARGGGVIDPAEPVT
jgi:aerobic-type carbon monoxide dehydrogenase small subunit (CoxS/CutS family)